MKNFLFVVLCMTLLLNVAYAQFSVNGVVFDNSTSQPLIGADIKIGNNVTTTNSSGMFYFNSINKGEHNITVSFVGYKTYNEIITIDNNINNLIVNLEPTEIEVNEIEINAATATINTPVAYSDIQKGQIQKLNVGYDVSKMLDMMPSLIFSSDNGSGVGYTDFKIRGTDLTRINVTMNGVPLNNSESHEMYFVDMPDFANNVDNIQIQRGVGTSVDGSAAFGATVDFKTQGVNQKPYSQITLSGGSFNTLRANIKAGTGMINNKFSVNVGLSKINSDGYIDRATSDLASMYIDAGYYGKNMYIKFLNNTGKENTYQAWNGASRDQMLISRTYNPAGEIYRNDTLIGYYDNETDNYLLSSSQLLFGYKILPGLKFNATFHYTYGTGYYENYKNDEDIDEYQLFTGYILTPINSSVESTNLIRQKWVNSDFYGVIYSLNCKEGLFDAILGGGWSDYKGSHFGKVLWAENAIVTDPERDWYYDDSYKTDFNQYLKINLALSHCFNIYVDAQYRRVFYRIEGNRDDLVDITQQNTYNFFNPKAGLVWKNEKNRAYFSFAISNREPNRDDFTDADLGKTPRPERLNDIETGYSHTFNRVKLSASLYYMNYKDQLVLTGEINNVGAPIKVNVDRSYRAGIELEGFAEIIKKSLFWSANITLSDNKILEYVEYIDNWDDGIQVVKKHDKTDISFSPSVIAFNQFKYVFLDHFSVSLKTKYVGKQYIDNSSDDNHSLDSYIVNDVRFDYDIEMKGIISKMNIFLTINNVLNEQYESKAWLYKYYYGGQEYSEAGYFPQAEMNFMAGIVVKFE